MDDDDYDLDLDPSGNRTWKDWLVYVVMMLVALGVAAALGAKL